jgi:hypothetical protein
MGDGGLGLAVAIAGVAIAAAGTTVSVVQQQQVAKANQRLLNRQAENEATAAGIDAQQRDQASALAEQEAAREADAQKFRERRERERQRFLTGHIRATTAASGLLLEGSPLFVLHEQLRQTELGLLAGRAESEARQVALRREGQQQAYAADVTRFAGANRLRLGRFAAGLTAYEGTQGAIATGLEGTGSLLAGSAKAYRDYQYGQYLQRQ